MLRPWLFARYLPWPKNLVLRVDIHNVILSMSFALGFSLSSKELILFDVVALLRYISYYFCNCIHWDFNKVTYELVSFAYLHEDSYCCVWLYSNFSFFCCSRRYVIMNFHEQMNFTYKLKVYIYTFFYARITEYLWMQLIGLDCLFILRLVAPNQVHELICQLGIRVELEAPKFACAFTRIGRLESWKRYSN